MIVLRLNSEKTQLLRNILDHFEEMMSDDSEDEEDNKKEIELCKEIRAQIDSNEKPNNTI